MSNLKKIKIFKLKRFKNPKGDVLRGFRKTDKSSNSSAEVYFSWLNKKAIKGWKLHKKMSMNLLVPFGCVRFVFFDGFKFKEIVIGEKKYFRIYVPSNILFAFQNVAKTKSLIVNSASILHQSKNETVSIDLNKINYKWKK